MLHTRYMMSFLVYNPERLGRSVSLLFKTQCVEVRNLRPIPVHIGHDIIWVKIFYECFKELGQAAYYTVPCLVAKTYKLERSIVRHLLPHSPAAAENSNGHEFSLVESPVAIFSGNGRLQVIFF